MDIQTIDQEYQQLESEARATAQEISALADKLQAAAQTGNQDAREWLLDLKSIALAMKVEQNQVQLLLQALHAFVTNQASAMQPSAAQPPGPWTEPTSVPPSYQPGYGQSPPGGAGGMLSSFLHSGFGRAIEMGAGFGIGDDLINKIF